MAKRNPGSLEKMLEYLREENARLWGKDAPPSRPKFASLQEEINFLIKENRMMWEKIELRVRIKREQEELDDLPSGWIRDASGVHPPGEYGL